MFLYPHPSEHELASYYDEKYYGAERKKFVGGLEHSIRVLTRWKWRGLERYARHVSGARVLDVGCGRGTLVAAARERGFEAYGVERSFGEPPYPYVFYKELEACAFPDDHFQLVVIWHVLEHLSRPVDTLAEIFRLLRPGGFLSVAVPNYGGAQAQASRGDWFHLDLPRHLWHFRDRTLASLLERTGFRVIHRATLSLDYDWFGTLQSWMNRAAADRNALYATLKGQPHGSWLRETVRLSAAAILAAPALASALWDAARDRGGTLHFIARKPLPGEVGNSS